MPTDENNTTPKPKSRSEEIADEISDTLAKLEVHKKRLQPEGDLQRVIFWTERKLLIDQISKLSADFSKELNKQSLAIQEKQIAEPMDTIGLSSFQLKTGQNVELDKKYHAKIPVAKQEEAFQWLVDNGFADTIKNVISQTFPAGEQGEKNLGDALEKIKETGLPFDLNKSIHASTLKALVKERMEKGEEVPMETLGVFVEKVIKIK